MSSYPAHCPRCMAGEHHVSYDHGPYAWVWSHDVSAPECHGGDPARCTFTFGCSRCDVVEVSIGPDGRRFTRFARRHRHGGTRFLGRFTTAGRRARILDELAAGMGRR